MEKSKYGYKIGAEAEQPNQIKYNGAQPTLKFIMFNMKQDAIWYQLRAWTILHKHLNVIKTLSRPSNQESRKL